MSEGTVKRSDIDQDPDQENNGDLSDNDSLSDGPFDETELRDLQNDALTMGPDASDTPNLYPNETPTPSAPIQSPTPDPNTETKVKVNRPKKREFKLDPDGMDEEIRDFVIRMETATRADQDANINRKPALHRYKMLEEVRKMTFATDLHEALLVANYPAYAAEWLQKLPDGTLPNSQIRTTILRSLDIMPIKPHNLRGSELGKIVRGLSINPAETQENQALEEKLIQKWGQQMVESSRAYQSNLDRLALDTAGSERQESETSRKIDSFLEKRRGAALVGDPSFRYTPAAPKRATNSFSRMPVSTISQQYINEQKKLIQKQKKTQQSRLKRQ
ncbi:putative transcription factor SPN1 [Blattamonas nauphoetae]|uniref:Transcription factor SPN1 n=1 Tax=Blattamonas nauphoetae TaxID=2049346 RepID=A0ABQ9YCI2_9EUKA|nr:putative transcription factor SPN1 [Blattamonas nauphoetae]